MSAPQVPVNRTLVGVLGLLCCGAALVIFATSIDSTGLWAGAFSRVGVILGAFWLALPSRGRDAAWANVSIWKVLGTLGLLIAVVKARVPLRLLAGGLIIFGVALFVLRPRGKTRPSSRGN